MHTPPGLQKGQMVYGFNGWAIGLMSVVGGRVEARLMCEFLW